MDKKRNISTLGQVIRDIAGSKNWQEKLERHRLFSFWNKVVGPDISSHARPKFLRGTVLWVNVSDSVWMQHLHFQKSEILESINARLHGTAVEDLRFQLVSSFPVEQENRDTQNLKPKRLPDPEEELEFDKMTLSVADESVRRSMKILWLAQKARQE